MANIVEKFENSFNECLGMLINQENYNVDPEAAETSMGVERTMNQFLEATRQMSAFFVQKRLILTAGIGVKDTVEDLRSELQRKEQLLQRQQDKLHTWHSLASRSSGSAHSTQATPTAVNHPEPKPEA